MQQFSTARELIGNARGRPARQAWACRETAQPQAARLSAMPNVFTVVQL